MQMNKEQLQKKIGELESQNKEWSANDEQVRKNVSQFLGSIQHKSYSGGIYETKILRWSEIYYELGKQMARKDFMDFEGNVSELECKLEDLEKKIKTEIHPNL